MALSKQKKSEVVDEVGKLLSDSKLTVVAKYSGTSVQDLQQLRRQSRGDGTTVRVVKNRLFRRALSDNDTFKGQEVGFLSGQLLYAFNDRDEVAPAQNLAAFNKNQAQLEFVGALSADGRILSADEVKELASLPSKDQLRAQLVGTIAGPLSGFVNILSGNVRGVLNVLNARAEKIS